MSGKGSARRPKHVADDTFANNWAAIFQGRSSTAEQAPLTRSVASSNLAAPAIFIDDATGK